MATTVSKCFQGSPKSFYNPCNRCFERLHVQAQERRIAMEMFAQGVRLHFEEDPADVIQINASLNVINRHWERYGDKKKERIKQVTNWTPFKI